MSSHTGFVYLIKSEQRTDELKLKVHDASDANVNIWIFIVQTWLSYFVTILF